MERFAVACWKHERGLGGEKLRSIAVRAPPLTRADANQPREDARKMALVSKAASHRHVGKRNARIAQQLSCSVDAPLHQPLVR